MAEYIRLKDASPECLSLFRSASSKQLLNERFTQRPNKVLPGLYAGDEKYLNFLFNLSDELDQTFVPKINELGFCDTSGISRKFDTLKSVSGFKGCPAGHVMHDNSLLRTELNLPNQFISADHELIFRELMSCMFSHGTLKPLKVADNSSSGLPDRLFRRHEKSDVARKVLYNATDVMKILVDGNYKRLLADYSLVNAFVQNYRVSADKFGKRRFAASFEYAISGGSRGNLDLIDYTVSINGQSYANQACRPRLVMGMNNAINILISSWRTCVSAYHLKEYAYTWKHSSKEEVAEKLNQFIDAHPNARIVGLDVAQFDTTVPSFMLHYFCDCLADKFTSELFAEFLRSTLFAPVFLRDVGDGIGPVFHGNPITNSYLESPGLLSGHDLVSTLGKLLNVFNFLVLCYHTSYGRDKVIGNIHNILKGHANFGLLNMGDDTICLFNNEQMEREFFKAATRLAYFKIEREASLRFLGINYMYTDRVTGCNDVVSFLTNTFVPEKAWDSKFRKFWYIGIRDRYFIYQNNPSFYSVLELVDKAFEKFSGKQTFTTYCNNLLANHAIELPSAMSIYDLEFLANPESIHYKLDSDLIDPNLLNEFFAAIDIEEYQNIVREHFKFTLTK